MKTNFRTLVATSLTLGAMAMLTGCGGGGTSAGANVVATELAQTYTLETVDAPTGAWDMQLTCISQNGDMVGTYKIGEVRHVFRYKNGKRTDLTNGEQDYKPTSVNGLGMIGGSYDTDTATLPFTIVNAQVSNPPLIDQAKEGWIAGYDNAGTKYTTYTMNDDTYRAFMTKDGTTTPITVDGNANVGLSNVSQDGHLAGWVMDGGTYVRVIFNPATSTWEKVLLNSTSPGIRAVNDSGSYVGYEMIGGKGAAFVQVGTSHINPSQTGANWASLAAINAGNIAVGGDQVQEGAYQVYHAFGWSQGAGYIDLNTRITNPGTFIARTAYGIDSQGRIIGYGTKGANQVGFILTPVKN